jgi:hypothetical protein
MASNGAVRELLDDTFEELAMALGGLVSACDPEDEFVERFVLALHTIRDKALQRLDELPSMRAPTPARVRMAGEPHPAIEKFLARLGRS